MRRRAYRFTRQATTRTGTLRQATDNQGDGLGAPTGCQIVWFWREAQSNSTHTDSGGSSLLVSPCFRAYISKSTRLMRLSL
ncbi:hypothetical protein D3C85_446250 [compost metagenome]